MPFIRMGALMALGLMASPLYAESSVVITLSGVRDRIRSQNPDLAAARFRIQEALGRMNQSGRLANPELETAFEHNPSFREGRLELGYSQRFPVTNRLRLEKEVSLTEMKAAEAEVRDVERRMARDAREMVVKILATRQRRDVLREQAATSLELASALAEMAAKGEGSPLDAGQAKLEASGLELEIRQLEIAEASLVGELKPCLGMRPGESLTVSGSLPEPTLPVAGSKPDPPDLEAARLEALAARQGVTLEQSRRYEDVEGSLFAAAERIEDAPNGYENEAIIGLRFKVPLPFRNQNEGAIQEAEARQQRKAMESHALGRSIELQAQALLDEMREWSRMIGEINATLLPLADEQSRLAEEAYNKAQGDIQNVFRSREKRMQLRATQLDALREFHLARIRYEATLGH